jgi:hypothetical protein
MRLRLRLWLVALLAVAAASVAIAVYWRTVVDFLVFALAARILYGMLRSRLGVPKRSSSRRTLVEVAVAAAGGAVAGRRLASSKRAISAGAARREERAEELHRAKLRKLEAEAEYAEEIARHQRRQAERARGITSSEIAQLQMGR